MFTQTVTALVNFFLAMVWYPEVQERAQKELDEVIGHSRLPEFVDRASLPYISAVVKETLRWKPVAPLCTCSMSYIYMYVSNILNSDHRCCSLHCGQ